MNSTIFRLERDCPVHFKLSYLSETDELKVSSMVFQKIGSWFHDSSCDWSPTFLNTESRPHFAGGKATQQRVNKILHFASDSLHDHAEFWLQNMENSKFFPWETAAWQCLSLIYTPYMFKTASLGNKKCWKLHNREGEGSRLQTAEVNNLAASLTFIMGDCIG